MADRCSHRFPDGTYCTLTDHSIIPGLAAVHDAAPDQPHAPRQDDEQEMTLAEELAAGCDCGSLDGGHPGDCAMFRQGEQAGCDCAELCSMGPTCPGGMLARLPGSGCWRQGDEQAAGGVTLAEDETRSLIGLVQRTLVNGETGMSDGDCNRAGWHIGEALKPAVERILTAHRDAAERAVALCSQCGEMPSVMVKIGTTDGWCERCLDEAAEPAAEAGRAALVARVRYWKGQTARAEADLTQERRDRLAANTDGGE